MFWWCFGTLTANLSKMMQEKAKIYTFLQKKIGEFCARTSPFSPIKHVFCLKNGQNWRFNLWKCAARACAWKHPKRILSIFMHIYEGLDDFWTVFFWWRFTLFCNHLGPIRSQKRVILGWFWGSIRGHFFCIVYIDVVGNVSLGKKTLCSGFFSVPGFFSPP